MILCAGLGTRMRPLTEWRAKPLAPVGDAPALAQVLAALRRSGRARIVINAHHRAEDVRAFLRERDGAVALSEEKELLGTAGGVRFARALLGEGDVLVWNGDIHADIDVAALLAAHRAEATLLVRPAPLGSGNVGIAKDSRIVRLRRETTAPGEVRSGEFVGVHVLGSRLRDDLPVKGCLVGDVYLPALRRGAVLDAFSTDVPFWDIGTIAAYLNANMAWLASRGVRSWVAPSAKVGDGVWLEGAIVHAGAQVMGSGRMDRVVVWEGATCRAPIADAVVAPEGIAR